MAPATPVFAGEPAPTEGGVAFKACAASVVYRCAPHLSGNWRDPLWERACPRSRRRDGWHRLRRCSRVNPLPQSGVAFKACAASVVYRCAPTFPETGAIPCESGHAREAGDVMDGTGYAGVRGRARSHRGWCGLQCMCCLSGISVCPPPFWKLARSPVGAGMPAKQATRWMAPATPVFAGAPAPTEGGVAFKACAASVVYRCAPTFPETGAIPCESGHAREAGDAMDGTGYAGVRGRARSHMGCAGL